MIIIVHIISSEADKYRIMNTDSEEFDDDFRNMTSVNVGDVFDISFETVEKCIGIQKIEVIGIRKDRALNHLENR